MPGIPDRVRWNLAPVYSSFDDPSFARDKDIASALAREFAETAGKAPSGEAFAPWLASILGLMDETEALVENLGAYCYASFSVDTKDARAQAEINAVEELKPLVSKARASFRESLASRETELRAAWDGESFLPYRFILEEELFESGKQMRSDMEELAADLSRSGADAWSRLQESLSSNASAPWEEETGERKTVVELRGIAYDPDRAKRERAFRKELACWESVEIPMAAALNGVKGANVCLDARRGWEDALERSARHSRIQSGTLGSLIASLEESLPAFRRYLKAKAKILGIGKLAFFDLFAPLGPSPKRYSWEEIRSTVVSRFSGFDPLMGDFARRAFDGSWIDAQPRAGKVGGAFCIDFPSIGESRILCNDEGSYYTLSTVAHELGHAYHHDCVKDLPHSLKAYPMTLAESASIFAETLVIEGALSASEGAERLSLIEFFLRDACQVVVDILSRFYFERDVFKRRADSEIPPAELCAMMADAQARTYGDALDPGFLHPYMWAAKGHYYYADTSFYNFPYAFGLLFALGLYARSREEGKPFAARYREILRETGKASAEDVARKAGYAGLSGDFWRQGLALVEERVLQFESAGSAELRFPA
jgi:oligoendopeptidase F